MAGEEEEDTGSASLQGRPRQLLPDGEAVAATAMEIQRTHPASSQEQGKPG